MGVMGVMEVMRKRHTIKNSPAQQDSKMLAVRLVPQSGDPSCPLVFKTSPAQRDSKMLAVRLVPQSGDPYRPLNFKTSPAQRDSKMSNLNISVKSDETQISQPLTGNYMENELC
jgi:hypothetical protein